MGRRAWRGLDAIRILPRVLIRIQPRILRSRDGSVTRSGFALAVFLLDHKGLHDYWGDLSKRSLLNRLYEVERWTGAGC